MAVRITLALLGFGLVIAGTAMLSIPAAMIIGGLGLWYEADRG